MAAATAAAGMFGDSSSGEGSRDQRQQLQQWADGTHLNVHSAGVHQQQQLGHWQQRQAQQDVPCATWCNLARSTLLQPALCQPATYTSMAWLSCLLHPSAATLCHLAYCIS
jgi:hypothetical protein